MGGNDIVGAILRQRRQLLPGFGKICGLHTAGMQPKQCPADIFVRTYGYIQITAETRREAFCLTGGAFTGALPYDNGDKKNRAVPAKDTARFYIVLTYSCIKKV